MDMDYEYKAYASEGVYQRFFDTIVKQKVLEYFRQNENKKASNKDISEGLKIPTASVNRALHELSDLGVLQSVSEGKFINYSIDPKLKSDFDEIFEGMEKVRRFTLQQRKKQRKEMEVK